jgi:hypothetical protein
MHLCRELGGQPALADAARPDDDHHPARARVGVAPQLAQPVQVGVAPSQRRRGVELARQLGGLARGPVQGRVLAQDRLVEAPQLGAGLDPDLLDECVASLAVGLERLGLAA